MAIKVVRIKIEVPWEASDESYLSIYWRLGVGSVGYCL